METRTGLRCRSTIWKTSCPLPLPSIYTVTDDPKEPTPIEVLFHGDYQQPTARVGARPLGILLPEETPEEPVNTATPRLKLAELDCRCITTRSLRA